MDVQMPEMDGLEAARQICKRWPVEKRPRIIAMTGNALMGDREKCIEAGMDDYISKPIRLAELQTIMEKWGALRAVRPDTAFISRQSLDVLMDDAVIAELREMPSANGGGMLRALTDLFLESAPQQIATIQKNINDAPNLAAQAQSLKGVSQHLGARRMVQLSGKLEEMGHAGLLIGAPQVLKELETAFQATREKLLSMREK
jgi:CheY-like chemotaxis protein